MFLTVMCTNHTQIERYFERSSFFKCFFLEFYFFVINVYAIFLTFDYNDGIGT
jgi:hypothetical protein